jgi:hypothetical protein
MMTQTTLSGRASFRSYWNVIKENQPDDLGDYMESEVFSPKAIGPDFMPD